MSTTPNEPLPDQLPPEPGEETDHSGNIYPDDVPVDDPVNAADAVTEDDDLTDQEA